MNDPFARHETYLEIWTAPADVSHDSGGKVPGDEWRQHQRCLAICHQMSMVIPLQAAVKVNMDVKL